MYRSIRILNIESYSIEAEFAIPGQVKAVLDVKSEEPIWDLCGRLIGLVPLAQDTFDRYNSTQTAAVGWIRGQTAFGDWH